MRRPRRHIHLTCALGVCLALAAAACSKKPGKSSDPAIATAFAGPVKLTLRSEISPASQSTASAAHGEKLEVLQVRRRFVRVRTPRGDEGWTDARNLLTAAQMEQIAEQAKRAARLPSQGAATVYSTLNVHTDPSRFSTSFYQVSEGMRFDVVAHKFIPRTPGAPPPAATFKVDRPAAPVRRKKKEPAVPPPPKPPAPGLPPNWRELSTTRLPEPPPPPPEADFIIGLDGVKRKKKKKPPPKQPGDDWYLVRTKDGKAGWVLARNVVMAIPDEVAQYSEGARITSYFALADVQDGEETKHHWLWTTIREGQEPYEFDSFRVFTWVVRRHRYETAYIERGIVGYYPVEAVPGKTPRFSLVLKAEDGKLYRKTYIMEGYLVRKIADEPYRPGGAGETPGSKIISDLPPDGRPEDEPKPSLGERIRGWFKRAGLGN